MKKNHLLTGIAAVMLTGGLFTSCSDNEIPAPDEGGKGETKNTFVIPASTTHPEIRPTYCLQPRVWTKGPSRH